MSHLYSASLFRGGGGSNNGFILKLSFQLMSIKLNLYNSPKHWTQLISTPKVIILKNEYRLICCKEGWQMEATQLCIYMLQYSLFF